VHLALLRIGGSGTPDPPAGFEDCWAAGDAAGVDAALQRLDGHRLVIESAGLSGLNLVLTRMLRAGLLDRVETALLLAEPVAYLSSLGLPADRGGQLAVARTGTARLVGVVKDDSGGLCVSGATLTAWTPGAQWWVRAVVDDQRLCDGAVREVSLRRTGPAELIAEARLGRFRRSSCRGRSLQLACDPARIVADGTARERPRSKRTFWSEPALWRLAL
jgi:hypothetical protein